MIKSFYLLNIVNNIVVSLYVDRGHSAYGGEHLVIYIIVGSLHCTPETNETLYKTCISFLKILSPVGLHWVNTTASYPTLLFF